MNNWIMNVSYDGDDDKQEPSFDFREKTPTKADMANIIVKLMEQLNPNENQAHEDLMVEAIKVLEPDLVLTDALKKLMIKGETWYRPDFEDDEFEEDLTFDIYQEQAHKTAQYDNDMIKTLEGLRDSKTFAPILNDELGKMIAMFRLFYLTAGLTSEAGEVADKVKKFFRNNNGVPTEEDFKSLEKEIGDVLWYCAEFATWLQKNLSEIAQMNLDKLQKRANLDLIKSSGDDREEI